MTNRGFGLEIEKEYGTEISKADFDLDWWNQADNVEFKLNDEPVTRSGSSRMNKRVRAGVMKPSGSTTADADLQQLAWYFRGYLDNYKHTNQTNDNHMHEFWGGENKYLTSFRGIAVYDELKKYLYGLLLDQLKLEVQNEGMTVQGDWIYKTEKAGIIGEDGETFEQPDELSYEELFIMFYDLDVKLNNKLLTDKDALGGVATQFSFEGNNNHDVDSTIGFSSRAPQKRAAAIKRENSISLTTSLTKDTIRSILNAEYGEVGALQPSNCKLLQVPLELDITHCENSSIKGKILFPKCTLHAEYNLSGADIIEVTLSLDTLGSGTVKLADNTEIETDMYVQIVNKQDELVATQ